MVDWLQPLELQTVFMTLFAGDLQIFLALSIICISAMAGYFRNTTLTFVYMLGLFLFMFSEYFAGNALLIIFSILAGLAVGFAVSKMWGDR